MIGVVRLSSVKAQQTLESELSKGIGVTYEGLTGEVKLDRWLKLFRKKIYDFGLEAEFIIEYDGIKYDLLEQYGQVPLTRITTLQEILNSRRLTPVSNTLTL